MRRGQQGRPVVAREVRDLIRKMCRNPGGAPCIHGELFKLGFDIGESSVSKYCAPMKVQQELMRHASIQTTMSVYGQAMLQSKREANRKVVEMALRGAPLPQEIAPAMATR